MSTKPKIDPRKIQRQKQNLQSKNTPQELQRQKTWVNWCYYPEEPESEKFTKRPVRFENGKLRFAQINNPKHFVSYEEALNHTNEKIGIGFVLTEHDPFVAIDVDHCFNNRKLTQEAEEIVKLFNSYTEISPSGEGLRIFIKANEQPTAGGNRKGYFEQYSKDRYVTVTGNLTNHELKEIQFRDEELKTYISNFISNKKDMQEKGNLQHASSAENNPQKKELLNQQTQESFPQQKNSIREKDMKKNNNPTTKSNSVKLTDDQVIKKASKAENKNNFLPLWDGTTTNPNKSDNDEALLVHLAFWTRKDPEQMDRLFRESALMRDKWDRKTGDTTYGQLSIQRAIKKVSTIYTGKQESYREGREDEGKKSTGGRKNNASNAQKIKPTSKEERRKNKPQEYPNFVQVNEYGKRSVNIDLARDAVLESIPQNTLVHEEQFYQYTKGKWEILKKEYMIRVIDKMIPKGLGKASITSEIFNHTKNRLIVRGENVEFNQHKNLFNFLNGNLNLETGELEPHNPDLYQTVQFSFNFNPKAECPKFFQFLKDIGLSKKTVMSLQEWFGYIMYPDTPIQQCLFLFGEGANGKSTISEVMKEIIGEENTCSLEPNEFTRFSKADLDGKLLNLCTDLSTRSTWEGFFKKVVSGEAIQAERKYQKSFWIKPFAKHVFSSNNYMPTKDRTLGFFRRFFFIEFFKTIPQEQQKKNFFENELKQEMEGIINWAIQGLYRLIENNWNFTQSEETIQAIENFKKALNPLAQFIDEECEINPLEKIEKTRFRDAYYDWCRENKYKELTSNKLTREMKLLGYTLKETSESIGGKKTKIRNYHGLNLKPMSDY